MGLESATFIHQLNANNPVNLTDTVGQGDDHLRLVKSCLLNTFPAVQGEMSLSHTQLNNAAIKNEANEFTVATTGDTYAVELLSTVPGQLFYETGAAADEKAWDIVAVSGSLRFRSMNDKPITASNTFLQADKSGAEIGAVSIKVANDENALVATANGAVDLYYDNGVRLKTQSDGVTIRSAGDTDTENRLLRWQHQTGLDRAYIGHVGNDNFDITNRIHGANTRLLSEDAGGTQRLLFLGDPDGAAQMFYAGVSKVQTNTVGIELLGLQNNALGGNVQTYLTFSTSTASDRGYIGFAEGNADFDIRSINHGGHVKMRAENTAGTLVSLVDGDPDGSVTLYEQGGVRFQTISDGINVRGISSNDPTAGGTQDTRINFQNSGALQIGLLEWPSSAEMRLHNLVHGGNIALMSQQTAGGNAYVVLGDPDGSAQIYYDSVATLRTADRTAADKGTGAEVLDGNGTFVPVGFNILPATSLNGGNVTLALANVGHHLEYNTASARSLFANNDGNIPIGASWSMHVGPSGGTLTMDGGAGVTLRYWNGASYTDTAAAGNITLGEGRHFIRKASDTVYTIDGPNIS